MHNIACMVGAKGSQEGWRTTHFWKTWLQSHNSNHHDMGYQSCYVYIAETAELQKLCALSALAS